MVWLPEHPCLDLLEPAQRTLQMPSKTASKSLAGNQLFASIDPEGLRMIEARCQWWCFEAGEQIIDRESDNRDVYAVSEGSVRVVNYSSSGREVAYAVTEAGSYFGPNDPGPACAQLTRSPTYEAPSNSQTKGETHD